MKKTGKIFLGFLILMGVAACVHNQTKRGVASEYKPRHFIMTLHGVRDTQRTAFAKFNTLIKEHLEVIDPAYKIVPITGGYPVADNNFDTYKAAPILNAEMICAIVEANKQDGIDEEVSSDLAVDESLSIELQKLNCLKNPNRLPQILPDDKFSMVAYSMGGQVGMAWYYSNLYGNNAYTKTFSEKMDIFFGLGSPYWGSVQSSWGVNSFNVLKKALQAGGVAVKTALSLTGLSEELDKMEAMPERERLNALANPITISGEEMLALSTLSPTTHRLRQDHLYFAKNQKTQFPHVKTKFISLAGLFNCRNGDLDNCDMQSPEFKLSSPIETAKEKAFIGILSYLNKYFMSKHFFGYKRHESDMVVIVPSANADFYYYKDDNGSSKQEIAQEDFKKITDTLPQSKLFLKETIHATIDGGMFVGDMVIVRDNCRQSKDCNNPVYPYLVSYLAHCDQPNATPECQQNLNTWAHDRISEGKDINTLENSLYNDIYGFVVELNLRLPKDYQLPQDFNPLEVVQFAYKDKNYVRNGKSNKKKIHDGEIDPAQFTETPPNTSLPYYIQMARSNEFGSSYYRLQEMDQEKHLRIFLTARYAPKNANAEKKCKNFFNGDCLKKAKAHADGFNKRTLEQTINGTLLPFKIDLPGYQLRDVKAKIQRGYSTYIDLNMIKN